MGDSCGENGPERKGVMVKEIVVTCKQCGRKLKTDERYLGKKGKCPHCGAVIRLAATGVKGATGTEEQVVTVDQLETREGALLEVRKQDGVGVVNFTTSRILDQSNVQQLGEEFDELLDKHKLKKLVINFEKINYMSSAVMGKLVALHKKVKQNGGQLRLTNIAQSIYEIFEIMRFDQMFDIRETEDEAVVELMS